MVNEKTNVESYNQDTESSTIGGTTVRGANFRPLSHPDFVPATVPDKQSRQILLNVYFSLKSPEKEFLKIAP